MYSLVSYIIIYWRTVSLVVSLIRIPRNLQANSQHGLTIELPEVGDLGAHLLLSRNPPRSSKTKQVSLYFSFNFVYTRGAIRILQQGEVYAGSVLTHARKCD